jgi:hypothetical protein
MGMSCSPRPARPPHNLQSLAFSPARCVCTTITPRTPAARRRGARASHLTHTPRALLATRQHVPLSDANKLLIRCAWAGNPAFVDEWPSAGHGPGGYQGWPSDPCP